MLVAHNSAVYASRDCVLCHPPAETSASTTYKSLLDIRRKPATELEQPVSDFPSFIVCPILLFYSGEHMNIRRAISYISIKQQPSGVHTRTGSRGIIFPATSTEGSSYRAFSFLLHLVSQQPDNVQSGAGSRGHRYPG